MAKKSRSSKIAVALGDSLPDWRNMPELDFSLLEWLDFSMLDSLDLSSLFDEVVLSTIAVVEIPDSAFEGLPDLSGFLGIDEKNLGTERGHD